MRNETFERFICTMILVLVTAAVLLNVGCQTVPESVQQMADKRQSSIKEIHEAGTRHASANPTRVKLWLPPGTYTIPENFKFLDLEIPQNVDVITMVAVNAVNDMPMPENVAITALRVLAPLIGFGIGAWQNVEINRNTTEMFGSLGAGVFDMVNNLVTNPIRPEIVTVP